MININLDSRQNILVKQYRDFTNQWILPHKKKFEQFQEFPHQIVQAAYDEGLANNILPTLYGGQGLNAFDSALAAEELAKGSMEICHLLNANSMALTPILLAGTQQQKKIFFTLIQQANSLAAFCLGESLLDSDITDIQSTAIRKGDKYIINGKKRFIVNGDRAVFHLVFALTDKEKGAKGLSAFVVPGNMPGITYFPVQKKMDHSTSYQCDISYQNVEVSHICLIGKEGEGLSLATQTLDRTRTNFAAASVGKARAVFAQVQQWSKERIQRGTSQLQGRGFKFADMAMQIEAASLLTWKAAWLYDIKNSEARKFSHMAKSYASEVAMGITSDAFQLMEAEGRQTRPSMINSPTYNKSPPASV